MSVREGLLSLLAEGPNYGFQLKTQFEAATGGTWPLNVGQVYTTLDRLERDGLVAVEEIDNQKMYELTNRGRKELDSWWESVPADGPPPRDELLIKLLLALPHGRDHALAVLSRQRTALGTILHARRRASLTLSHRGPQATSSSQTARSATASAPDPASLFANSLVNDAVLLRAEADLRWLDRCEARILDARPEELSEPDFDFHDPHPTGSPVGSTQGRRLGAGRTRRNRR